MYPHTASGITKKGKRGVELIERYSIVLYSCGQKPNSILTHRTYLECVIEVESYYCRLHMNNTFNCHFLVTMFYVRLLSTIVSASSKWALSTCSNAASKHCSLNATEMSLQHLQLRLFTYSSFGRVRFCYVSLALFIRASSSTVCSSVLEFALNVHSPHLNFILYMI